MENRKDFLINEILRTEKIINEIFNDASCEIFGIWEAEESIDYKEDCVEELNKIYDNEDAIIKFWEKRI